MARDRRKLTPRKRARKPFGGLRHVDRRSDGVDEIGWSTPSGHRVRVRRVHRMDGAAGVAVAWPSELSPRALAAKCPDRARAAAETDVLVLDAESGLRRVDGGLERFIKDSASDRRMSRLNTAYWSLSLWPPSHTKSKSLMVELVASQPSLELLRQLMGESITDEFKKQLPAILDAIAKFERSQPLERAPSAQS